MIFIFFISRIKMTTIDQINSFIKMKSEQIRQAKLDAEKARLDAMKNPLSVEETQKFLTHLLEQGEKGVGVDVYGSGPLKYEAFVEWYMAQQHTLKYIMHVNKGERTCVVRLFA
jgi:hypothetical protein